MVITATGGRSAILCVGKLVTQHHQEEVSGWCRFIHQVCFADFVASDIHFRLLAQCSSSCSCFQAWLELCFADRLSTDCFMASAILITDCLALRFVDGAFSRLSRPASLCIAATFSWKDLQNNSGNICGCSAALHPALTHDTGKCTD